MSGKASEINISLFKNMTLNIALLERECLAELVHDGVDRKRDRKRAKVHAIRNS